MAFNSDGYIMIDFTDVDFRRTNQTIEGLYKRCVDVIGTNKFILVINANGRTPLPATCSFTNNQYVIDTCIYMFAISSNDNLFIRRNDVPASDIIDDSSISVDKTWSSNKIDSELDTKADASLLADYQPLLTPVSPISIENDNISVDLSSKQNVLTPVSPISIENDNISVDLSSKQNVLTPVSPISIENDNISVDLSSKQNVLTAGDNITIINDVISSNQIKKYTYTGDGTDTLVLPIKAEIILDITAKYGSASVLHLLTPVHKGDYFLTTCQNSYNASRVYNNDIMNTWDNNSITIIKGSAGLNGTINRNNTDFTVYYI